MSDYSPGLSTRGTVAEIAALYVEGDPSSLKGFEVTDLTINRSDVFATYDEAAAFAFDIADNVLVASSVHNYRADLEA